MRKVLLKDIAFVKAGNSAPSKDEFTETGVPFVRAGSLEFLVNGESIEKCEKVDLSTAKKKKLKLYSKGSILFAKSGMSSKLGRIYMLSSDAYVVSHLAIISVFDKEVIKDYIKYYFQYRPPFHLIRDDAYPSIKLCDIEKIEIDIPDLQSQRQIVAALDKTQQLIYKRQKSIEQLDELLHSIFFEMFGDPILNDKNLKRIEIGKLTKVTSGSTPRRNIDGYYNGNIPWVKTTEVKGEFIMDTQEKITELGLENSSCKIIPINTVLVAMYGQGKTRGQVGIMKVEATTNQACAAILPNEELNPYYLFSFLNYSYKFLRSLGKGGNQPNLSVKIIKELEINIPSKTDQKKYSIIFDKVWSLKDSLQKKGEFNSLFQSLLQRAFHGDLLIDTDLQLDTFLESEDHVSIAKDDVLIQKLIDRFNLHNQIKNEQDKDENNFLFESLEVYEKAKEALFHLLKEGKAKQTYDESANKTILEMT